MPKAPEDPAIAEIRRRLLAIEMQQKAMVDALRLVPELSTKAVAGAQTSSVVAIVAVLDAFIRKGVISIDELITSIDGFLAERYGEDDVKMEGHVAEGLIEFLRGLKPSAQ